MKLNFGCGKKILEGYHNVDIQSHPGLYKSFDFNKFPYPLSANTYDYVLVDNVLEHLKHPLKVLKELSKSCKNGAIIQVKVPYYNCRGAYNDITHLHFFNDVTFDNLVSPHYTLKSKPKLFTILEQKLKPTRLGRLFPKFLRTKASYVLGEIYNEIDVRLKVNK